MTDPQIKKFVRTKIKLLDIIIILRYKDINDG